MGKRLQPGIIIALMVVVLVAAACAPAAVPAPSAPTAKPAPAATPTSKPIPTPTKAPPEKVTLNFSSYTTTQIPIHAAKAMGYWDEEGVDVTLQRLQSEISIKDLIGGGHDFEASVGSATTAILAGAKLKVLSIAGEKLPWSIIARPEIKSVQNLKGKRIGLSSLGSVVQQASMIALKNHGLDPSKDVIWMAAGGAEAAVKMILVGSIDAAVLSGAYILQLEKQGYNTVINLGEEVKGVTNGLVTHDKFLQERPQTVKKVLRGLLKGQKFYVSQVPKARAYYQKFAKENGDLDEALANELYDREAKQMNDSGYISDDVLRTWIGYLKVEAQVDRDVPLSEVYDLSIIKQVSQELKDWKP